ncbi:MAG: hypothetical protein IT426_09530 [Pirellulales bacterium]|nr:hypothetical protein [Pirellulales bacterium]
MNRSWILMLAVAFPAMLLAQNYPPQQQQPAPYQPAVPPPSNINSYGGYYSSGGGTAAGSAMNGMSNVISAKGNYNLSTSAAAINMTQAEKNSIQNAQLRTDTYFQMRATNTAARKAEAGPPPTMEQIARFAREGAPRPITEKEVNPTSGQISWPAALMQDVFAPQRAELEQMMTKQAKYGGLSLSDQMQARKTIENMFAGLKSQIASIPPQDYTTGRSFLNSMVYATSKAQLQ